MIGNIAIAIAGWIILYLVWYGFFHPWLSRLYGIPHYYCDISYYQNEEYLEFEHGDRLQDFLADYGANEKCDVLEFLYIDNSAADNPFWGKYYDIYLVDFTYPAEAYAETKSKAIAESIALYEESDYIIYILPNDPISSEYCCSKAIAFCEKSQTVRFILLSDRELPDTAYDVYVGIYHNFSDKWWIAS